MIPTKQGYMFSARRCGKVFGVTEEFKVSYKDDIIKVQATFGVDRKGVPLAPAIFRESRFIPLYEHLSTNGIEFDYEFEKFMRSRKPTYSMFNNMFLMCILDGWYDTKNKCWVENKTKLDPFMLKGASEVPNYGFNVFCNIIRTTEGFNTNCIAESAYSMLRREILSSMSDCIESRAAFIANRLGNLV